MIIDRAQIAEILDALAKLCRDPAAQPPVGDRDPIIRQALEALAGGGTRALQRALGVTDDGIVGVITRGALAAANVSELLDRIVADLPPARPASDAFLCAFDATMKWEGGYSNDPRDPGGETNFGISKAAHPDEDIKNMTRERAQEIARESYWLPSKANMMPPEVGPKVFDLAFNTGLGGASKILQRALNDMGAKLEIDGSTGPATLAAVGKVDPVALHAALRKQAEAYYRSLDGFPTFGDGWLNRNNDI